MTSDRDYYVKAVKTAEAAYDIVSAPAPLFVRWVSDSKAVRTGGGGDTGNQLPGKERAAK